jgi:hypothetical protein
MAKAAGTLPQALLRYLACTGFVPQLTRLGLRRGDVLPREEQSARPKKTFWEHLPKCVVERDVEPAEQVEAEPMDDLVRDGIEYRPVSQDHRVRAHDAVG